MMMMMMMMMMTIINDNNEHFFPLPVLAGGSKCLLGLLFEPKWTK